MNRIIQLRTLFLKTQFLVFFVVGVSAFFVDLGVLLLQINILQFNPVVNLINWQAANIEVNVYFANVISVFCGLTFGFFLNRLWTFKHTTGKAQSQIWQYYLVSILNLVLNNVIYGALIPLGFPPVVAKAFATFVQMFSSFTLYKFVVFRV